MAGSGLSFLVSLEDNVSGAAKAASAAIDGLTGAFDGFGKALEGIKNGDPGAVFAGLEQAATAAAEAMAKVVEIGAELAISNSTFREQTEISFQAILGSAKAADATYQKALDLAAKLGMKKEDVVDSMKRLMTAGLNEQEAAKAIQATADLNAANGSGPALEKIIKTVEAKGKVDARAIQSLAKSAGLPIEQIYESLSKATGKSIDQVKAALKAGTIDAKTALDAIEGTVTKRFGGAAEKMANTIPGLLNKIQIAFGKLFDHVDLGPIKKFLQGIADALNGPAGKKLGDAITKLFDALFKVFAAITGATGKKGPAGTIEGIASAISSLADFIKEVGPTVGESIRGIGKAAKWVLDHWLMIKALSAPIWMPIVSFVDAVVDVFSALVDAAEGVGEAFEAMGDLVDGFTGVLDGIASAVDGFVDEMSSLGGNLIDGLVQGIEGAAGAVVDAITSAVGGAIGAAKAMLGIASPSKVFAEIGGHTAAGFAGGIEDHPGPQKAITKMVAPPDAGKVAGAHAAAGRAGAAKGGAGGDGTVNITVNVMGGANASAADIAKAFASELRRYRAELGATS